MAELTEPLRKACPILNCKERILYEHFACKEHWYALPPSLRSKVYWSYMARVKTGKVHRHIESVDLCYRWYRDNGYGLK